MARRITFVVEPDHTLRHTPDLLEWCRWYIREWEKMAQNAPSLMRVGLDRVGDYEVSTVFLGTKDYNGRSFETRVTKPDGVERIAARAFTWDEAARAHAATIVAFGAPS